MWERPPSAVRFHRSTAASIFTSATSGLNLATFLGGHNGSKPSVALDICTLFQWRGGIPSQERLPLTRRHSLDLFSQIREPRVTAAAACCALLGTRKVYKRKVYKRCATDLAAGCQACSGMERASALPASAPVSGIRNSTTRPPCFEFHAVTVPP